MQKIVPPAFLMLTFLISLNAAGQQIKESELPYDLDQVSGMRHFPQDPDLRAMLSKNGFVVIPNEHKQIYSTYLKQPHDLPPFITVDTAMRTFQVLFQEAFKWLERQQVHNLKALSQRFFDVLVKRKVPETADEKRAHERVLAWAAVGLKLQDVRLDTTSLPGDARKLAQVDLYQIREGGTHESAIFQRRLRFSHLSPAGFYASEEGLARFFRAVKWFGLTGFRTHEPQDKHCIQLIFSVLNKDAELTRLLKDFLAPYGRILGHPDDSDFLSALALFNHFGRDLEKTIQAIPKPSINDQPGEDITGTKGLRLLPPRYTWEAQLRTDMATMKIFMPDSLCVPLSLGDAFAEKLYLQKWPQKTVQKIKKTGQSLLSNAPNSLYNDTFDVLSHLFQEPPGEAPPFSHTHAWQYKCTWTGLASWTCIKQVMELHIKQVEIYGGHVRELFPAGYVSPYPLTFKKIGLLSEKIKQCFQHFEAPEKKNPEIQVTHKEVIHGLTMFGTLMAKLSRVSEKQLHHVPIDPTEHALLWEYGDMIGRLHLYMKHDAYQSPEDGMPLVTLYQTFGEGFSSDTDYYAGIGRGFDIYAIRKAPERTVQHPQTGKPVTMPEKLQLYRGTTFSFYDFTLPAGTRRLSNETWKDLLDGPEAPDIPEWADTFIASIKASDKERISAGEALSISGPVTPELREAAWQGYLKAVQDPARRDASTHFLDIFLEGCQPTDTDRLVDLISKVDDPEHQTMIAQVFSSLATKDLKKEFLANMPQDATGYIIMALQIVDDHFLLDELKRIFGASEEGRWAFASALGKIPEEDEDKGLLDNDKTQALCRLAQNDPSFLVRSEAFLSLGHADLKTIRPVLNRGLADPSPAVRVAACFACAKHFMAAVDHSVLKTLWYIDDPVVRPRTIAEGKVIKQYSRYKNETTDYWQNLEAPYLTRKLVLYGPNIQYEWFDHFFLHKFQENPLNSFWQDNALSNDGIPRNILEVTLISIISDSERDPDERLKVFEMLEESIPKDESACESLGRVRLLLDHDTIIKDGLSTAYLGAKLIFTICEGKELKLFKQIKDRKEAIKKADLLARRLDNTLLPVDDIKYLKKLLSTPTPAKDIIKF